MTAAGPIEEGVEDEDMDCLSQGVMSQGDECVTRVATGGLNANAAKAVSSKRASRVNSSKHE